MVDIAVGLDAGCTEIDLGVLCDVYNWPSVADVDVLLLAWSSFIIFACIMLPAV